MNQQYANYQGIQQAQTLHNQLQSQQAALQGQVSYSYAQNTVEYEIVKEIEELLTSGQLVALMTSNNARVRTYAERVHKNRAKAELMTKLREMLSEEEFKLL